MHQAPSLLPSLPQRTTRCFEWRQPKGRAGGSTPWPGEALLQGPVMDPRSLIGPEDEQKQKASCSAASHQSEKHESGGGLNNNKPLHHSACSAVLQSATCVMRDGGCCCKDEAAVHCRGAGPAVSRSGQIATRTRSGSLTVALILIMHSKQRRPACSICGEARVRWITHSCPSSSSAAEERGGHQAVLCKCRVRGKMEHCTATSQVGRRVHSSSCY